MFVIAAIIRFFVQALAIKLSVGTLKGPSTSNEYSTAITLSAVLAIVHQITKFIPIVGPFVYLITWLLLVRSTYNLSFFKSALASVMQLFVGWGIFYMLKVIGILGLNQSYWMF